MSQRSCHQNRTRASQPSAKAETSSLGWAFRLLDERLLDDLFVSHLQACNAGQWMCPGLLEAHQGPQLGMQLLHRQVSKDEELVTDSHKRSYKKWEPTWVCSVRTANTAMTCCCPLLNSDQQPPLGLMLGSTFLMPALLPTAVPSVPGLAVVSAARCEAVAINASCAARIQVND